MAWQFDANKIKNSRRKALNEALALSDKSDLAVYPFMLEALVSTPDHVTIKVPQDFDEIGLLDYNDAQKAFLLSFRREEQATG
jgi:hypothetical protein